MCIIFWTQNSLPHFDAGRRSAHIIKSNSPHKQPSTMSTSMFSDNSCALCERHKTPPDLNLHVSSGKTCADIHLELSLIDASQQSQKCLSGQNSYRSLCCPRQNFLMTELKVSVGVLTGAILIFFATKRVFSVKIAGEKSASDYRKMKDTPSKKKRGRPNQIKEDKKPCDEPTKTAIQKEGSSAVEEEGGSMLAMWNGNNS